MQAGQENIQVAIMGQYKLVGRIRTWPSWAHMRHMFGSCCHLLWAITISSAVAQALSYGHIIGLHETFVQQLSCLPWAITIALAAANVNPMGPFMHIVNDIAS